MTNKVYGYIRVSTREQNIERQLISLIEAGIDQKSIYIDKQSGKDFRRPAYKKMMRKVREGDTTKTKDLLGTFISDVVLQLLSFVAENERDNIRQRQAEGIAAAKARGVQFGKPMIPMPDNFPELYEEWAANRISIGELAELCNMGRSTMYKRIGEYKERLCQEEGN